MAIDASFWRGRRVLVTGHTGFKGGWLCLWLQSMGAQLRGMALEPSTPVNLFAAAEIAAGMESEIGDIRDFDAVQACMSRARPEVVLHLAAQSLVRRSYALPVDTFATNVMGTVHVLEAARRVGTVRCIVNVTTDKCYENRGGPKPYAEDEPLGGHDPYSSSKACSEMVTQAYRRSFLTSAGIATASARAGNVIGGGDWSEDRLVPDVLRALERGLPVVLRHPHATRPWQHVLEPLDGYLHLAQRLWYEGAAHAESFNLGPNQADVRPVHWIVERMASSWGLPPSEGHWTLDAGTHPHEAQELRLDITKAERRLGWRPRWNLDTALDRVVRWHRGWRSGQSARELCLEQISEHQLTPMQDRT